MTAAEAANPEGAAAEEFLWSLGVGNALPEWLKELRRKERSLGLNQEPRGSAPPATRPGIGPLRPGAADEATQQPPPAKPPGQDLAGRSVTQPVAATRPAPAQASAPEPTPRPQPETTQAPRAVKEQQRPRAFNMSIKEWLLNLDDSGFLVQYHDSIASKLDSLEQIVDVYVQGGEIDKQFFADAGVKKLGHKRLFEKWFKDNCW
mmetsp:Transcript_88652/g.264461  ORF Transcript_88652/g.264461 Transcript_88652/m.264461 type:complete len:205 (+) Transcript_88652:99-713(+)